MSNNNKQGSIANNKNYINQYVGCIAQVIR
jgi:hypothetical protein